MPAGRADGRIAGHARTAGFSLIELLVGIAVLGVLLALSLPTFSEWIRNNQIRVATESLRDGLQLARSEAVKRNTRVRLQLVTSLDNSCTLAASGPYWIANIGASTTVAGACASPVNAAVAPAVLQASPATAAASRVTVASSASVVAFDASGRLAATVNPTTTPQFTTINVTMPAGGSCAALGGSVRCLRVELSLAGQVRMCDPSQTAVSDPARCR